VHRIVAACALVLASVGREGAQEVAALDALTVPASARPAGCVPVPSYSEPVGQGRVRTGLWGPVPIDTNPWSGTKWRVLSAIRSTMFGPPRFPDAVPDARLNAKLGRDVVDGLTGYAAAYRDGETRLFVYALRSAGPLPWTAASPAERDGSTGQRIVRLGRGPTKVLAVGDPGACFAAVEQHLRAALPAIAGARDTATSAVAPPQPK
jgi:hypothetical protein